MAFRSSAVQRKVARVQSIPITYGGLNDSEPLAEMGAKYAIVLDNWRVTNLSLAVRGGYRYWVPNLPGAGGVKTLINYYKTDGTEELFACTNSGIYDVSGTESVPIQVTSLTAGEVSFTHFSNLAGNYLVVCNGVDPAQFYDGTTWAPFVTADTPTNPGDIKGPDPASLSYVLAYKGRLWFIQKASLTAWYGDVDALGGELKPFYFGSVYNRGGSLVQMVAWSFDSGEGLDDNIVFQTTAGEIAIYTGDDPAVAEQWQLQAMYYAGPPVGFRSSEDFGGDVLFLTRIGLIPLSTVIKGNLTLDETEVALSKHISTTLSLLMTNTAYTPNWELHNIPSLQAIAIIIPKTDATAAQQFVMNSVTQAWSRWTLPDMTCGRLFRNRFFFGDSNGNVFIFGNVTKDAVGLDGSGGEPIKASLITAFNYFDDATTYKNFKLIRPIFTSTAAPNIFTQIYTDYNVRQFLDFPVPPAGTGEGALWDEALWN